jgi:hypothetical protein
VPAELRSQVQEVKFLPSVTARVGSPPSRRQPALAPPPSRRSLVRQRIEQLNFELRAARKCAFARTTLG